MEANKKIEWEELVSESIEEENRWYPERIGDFLQGVIINVEIDQFENKKYLVKREDNMEFITPSHKVLMNKLTNAKVGDYIKIVYTGERQGKQKNATKLYDVFRRKNDATN